MRTLENDSDVISIPANDEATLAGDSGKGGHYDAVRYNAMQHGILSRYTVLPHENVDEYQTLLSALFEEHQPIGATEAHLVEELAGIIWRKRRVLMAEGATINRGLRSAVTANPLLSPVQAAAPFENGFWVDPPELAEMLTASSEEIAERQRDAVLDLDATRKAAAVLRKGGPNAYEKARKALIPESREWWDEKVGDESCPPTIEGLSEFIREHMEPICTRTEKEARLTPAIKAQTLGEGLQPFKLEQLNRYETHLDRKFERTLAMILKLKDLRGRG